MRLVRARSQSRLNAKLRGISVAGFVEIKARRRGANVACDKTNCAISLGLTIMDRCSECEKQERAAEEAERIVRNAAFAAKWTRREDDDMGQIPGVVAPVVDDDKSLREFVETCAPTLSCGCNKPHEPGTSFFVSCIEDSGQRRNALLLGPYDTHEEALANVDRGRKLAEANDPKAHWYSFGTCSINGPTERKGVFGK